MRVIVTGGAGYIGSHAVQRLAADGHQVAVIDNLSNGHRAAVPSGVPLVVADMRDAAALDAAFAAHRPDAVLHFAALSLVGDSTREPLRYWDNNVTGSLRLLEAMARAGCERLIFSSTCSVYGLPERLPITEETPRAPINPYGQTKLAVEALIRDHAAARPGFAATLLRYFNVAGCASDGSLGEDHRPETHLIPLVLQAAAGQRAGIHVFGTDYDTADGSCIRDYLHVEDLVDAHVRALDRLTPGRVRAMNLGTETGTSVLELLEAAQRVTGRTIAITLAERRPGDAPVLLADASRAHAELGWRPSRSDLDTILTTAWRWHSSHPEGYGDA